MELKENTTIVVLGASGDLAKKKTVRNGVSLPSPPKKQLSMTSTKTNSINSILLSLVW